MRFGTSHAFQVPPWTTTQQTYTEELERIHLAEALGYDSVWLPEQHFFDYCGAPDSLDLSAFVVGQTKRVRVGTAVTNISLQHPLRFAERASMLDLISGGRVDIGVGRGYQIPQNVVFGVAESDTKPMTVEALDIVLAAWDGRPHGYDGEHFSFPPVRIYPEPQRPASEVLLQAVGGTTPFSETIERGLPLALAAPFGPVEGTARMWGRYLEELHASDLTEAQVERLLDRAIVMVYALVAPSKHEALDIAKTPYEWHEQVLTRLRQPAPSREEWEDFYYGPQDPPPVISDDDWARRTDSTLLFTDPAGMREHIDVLHRAGVRTVLPWMGVGGVAQEHVLRSMRLFADDVAPHFR